MQARIVKIVGVVQARVGSSRLPGKVLKEVLGRSMLERQVERVSASSELDHVTVATSTESEDDAIEALCLGAGISCYRGHLTDLLDRHYQAGRSAAADAVVKIPSDCPLIDPSIIDRVVRVYREKEAKLDYVSNLHPPTYPDGNDVEVMAMDALARAHQEATKPLEREHTTPYFWDEPGRFRLKNVEWEKGKDFSMSHRFTVDYQADLDFVRSVYSRLYPRDSEFSLNAILELLEEEPKLMQINAKFAGVNWYRNHLDELQTVSADATRTPQV